MSELNDVASPQAVDQPRAADGAVAGDGSVEEEPDENPVTGNVRKEAIDDTLVQALAEGLTQVAAAKRAGTTDRTIRRRLEDPNFVARIREARRQMTDEANGRASALLGAAIDAIGDLVQTGEPATRLRAATLILRIADQSGVIDDLTDRVEELEAENAADKEAS